MQRKWRRHWRRTTLALLLSVTVAKGYAMPTDGQVTTGAATVAQSGHTMTINQTTDKAAINWQSFNIAANEQVTFLQPSACAIALNRVIGNNPSAIFGQLSANGRVFLINPNGILFAPGSRVNTGSLIASTLNLTDESLRAGHYTFAAGDNAGGVVVNQGSLQAADGGGIALIGPQVRNEGVIVARQGTVALNAGNQVTVDFAGDGKLSFAVDQAALKALAENKGLIQADGGVVLMTARSADALTDTVINNAGIIRAQSIRKVNGSIILDGGPAGVVTTGGVLDASGKNAGETGGTIKVLGDKAALTGSAAIDVSGDAGGGTALIGGNFAGAGPEQNASAVYIGSGATITADALTTGNGGRVAVWSNNATRFYGAISAQGGRQSGDGGQAETSGAWLDAQGTVKLGAVNGKGGSWLLDPNDIIISAKENDTNITPSSSPSFATNDDDAILSLSSLENALNTQGNVTITTSTSGSNEESGDITVDAPVQTSNSTDTTLTLNAARDIILNGDSNSTSVFSTSNSGKLRLVFNADSDQDGEGAIIVNKNISTGGGSIQFGHSGYTVGTYMGGSDSRTISTNGGAITFNGDVLLGTNLSLDTTTASGTGGAVTFNNKVDSGNSYTYVNYPAQSWEDAESAAKGNTGGGSAISDTYLAVITSSLENSIARSAAAIPDGSGHPDGDSHYHAWIGAKVTNNAGSGHHDRTWSWVTGPYATTNKAFFTETDAGIGTTSGYSAWRQRSSSNSEPDNASGNQNYAFTGYSTTGLWGDADNGWAAQGYVNGYIKETNLAGSTLTINAGKTGNVTFNGAVGTTFDGKTGNDKDFSLGKLTIQNAGDLAFKDVVHVPDISLSISGTATEGSISSISTGNLKLSGDTGTYNLTSAGNTISQLAGNVNSLSLTDTKDITIAGLTAAGNILVQTSGNITLNNGVTSTGTGTNVTLAAGDNFINNAGNTGVSAGSGGRWLIYGTSLAGNDAGGLDYGFSQYNTTYSNDTSAIQGTGNGFIYSDPLTLSASSAGSTTVEKIYDGTAKATLQSNNFTLAGLSGITGTIDASGVTASYDTENVGSSKNVTVDSGTVKVSNVKDGNDKAIYGYGFSGTIETNTTWKGQIDQATLTYTANPTTMTTGSAVPPLSGTVTGFVNGETQSSATQGNLAFTTTATSSSSAGVYTITGSGLSSDNYKFVQASSNKTALTVTDNSTPPPPPPPSPSPSPSPLSDTTPWKTAADSAKTNTHRLVTSALPPALDDPLITIVPADSAAGGQSPDSRAGDAVTTGSLVISDSRNANVKYPLTQTADSLTLDCGAALPAEGTHTITVIRVDNKSWTVRYYDLTADGSRLSLRSVPHQPAQPVAGQPAAATRKTHIKLSLDNGETGAYFVSAGGDALTVQPLDAAAAAQVKAADASGNRPIVITALLTALHDMGVGTDQIQTVYVHGE